MAELSTLARPYARAAFEFAVGRSGLNDWSTALGTAAAVCADQRVATLLASPSLTAEQLANTVIELCGDDFAEEHRNFIRVLAANKRLSLLPQISVLFEQLKAERESSVDVKVVSAFALDEAAEQNLVQVLSKKLEREVKVETEVDESLLGGVLIRAGDLVIDGSVRGRLNKLSEAMNS